MNYFGSNHFCLKYFTKEVIIFANIFYYYATSSKAGNIFCLDLKTK